MAFEAMVKQKPKSANVRRHLAKAHLKVGDNKAAVRELLTARRLEPQNPDTLIVLTKIFMANRDRKNAGLMVHELLRIDPENEFGIEALTKIERKTPVETRSETPAESPSAETEERATPEAPMDSAIPASAPDESEGTRPDDSRAEKAADLPPEEPPETPPQEHEKEALDFAPEEPPETPPQEHEEEALDFAPEEPPEPQSADEEEMLDFSPEEDEEIQPSAGETEPNGQIPTEPEETRFQQDEDELLEFMTREVIERNSFEASAGQPDSDRSVKEKKPLVVLSMALLVILVLGAGGYLIFHDSEEPTGQVPRVVSRQPAETGKKESESVPERILDEAKSEGAAIKKEVVERIQAEEVKVAKVETKPESISPPDMLTPEEAASREPEADLEQEEEPLLFGPLYPGKQDRKRVDLSLDKAADSRDITHELSSGLPEYIKLKTRISGRGTKISVYISASIDYNARIRQGYILPETCESKIAFASARPDVAVSPAVVPIQISLDTNPRRWCFQGGN